MKTAKTIIISKENKHAISLIEHMKNRHKEIKEMLDKKVDAINAFLNKE